MRTRSQRDAEQIYRQVQEAAANLDGPARVRYAGWCHRFPVLVLRAGLAEAAAFLEAKAGGNAAAAEGDRGFLQHLGATLNTPRGLAIDAREADLVHYRALTRRCLEVAVWYKRYAESVLGMTAADADREAGDA
ncbi:MAG: type III-B CRISPR module-associated protein Cmr5 [Nitrospirae bacterium]|nr:MAG: type III-B CRISPR module-associated protein Cmr5 [Nitrospirota bacterium]